MVRTFGVVAENVFGHSPLSLCEKKWLLG